MAVLYLPHYNTNPGDHQDPGPYQVTAGVKNE